MCAMDVQASLLKAQAKVFSTPSHCKVRAYRYRSQGTGEAVRRALIVRYG